MVSQLLLLLILAVSARSQSTCGAPQCYFPCTDSRPVVDIVFLIDVSGSMQPIIQAVTSGLSNFVNGLNGNNLNAAFAVALFGDSNTPDGHLGLSLTTSGSSFTSYMTNVYNQVTNNYNSNYCSSSSICPGSIEPGLEVLNQAMGTAASSNMGIGYRATNSNGKKVYILVTNEDSDMAKINANLFGSQKYGSGSNPYNHDGWCYNQDALASKYPGTYNSIPASAWPSWQSEINNVYSNIKANNANLYMFVPGTASLTATNSPTSFPLTCNTVYQYCNPDIQHMLSNYSSFNATLTYQNLVQNQTQNSLQGLLLNAGMTARCFEVQDLKGSQASTLINNFFAQITADLTACDTKCFNYTCLTSTTCAPPLAKCDCAGVPFTQGGTSTLDKNGVCCPAAQHDANNVCCTGKLDHCNVCVPTSSTSDSANCKQDCAGAYYIAPANPPHALDQCGNCVPYGTKSAGCLQDCAGTYYNNNITAPHLTDLCGYCVVNTANMSAHKDSCGVCDGGNAEIGPCGHCFESSAKDLCGHYVCLNQTCATDCDNVQRDPLTHHIDACGNCILNTVGTNAPYCVQDCAGTWYDNNNGLVPPHHVDECGNCVNSTTYPTRLPSCVKDCNGVWGGNSTVDNCNQCVVNNVPPHPCIKDCAGVYYISGVQTPAHTVDDCGICNTPANQNSLKDKCGVCTNSPGYNAANCAPDCKGTWRLVGDPQTAFTDGCGNCWFYNQRNMTNYYMDSCGYCFNVTGDPSKAPGWNQETSGTDSQGVVCKCNVSPKQCPGGSATTCNDRCPPACPGGGSFDHCGRCVGDMYYNTTLDDCGVCATANHTWDSDKDYCGVCFGGNATLQTNPCHICNSSLCHIDCSGTPGGTKTYDCAGICGGTTTVCSVCGDGNVTIGEECDLGSKNGQPGSGCTSDCKTVAAADVGAIAGGVVGALVGLVVLGLAAFLAVQYAKKNGLIGNANKQLDMASSNSNPLYKSEVNVQHNPLYGQS